MTSGLLVDDDELYARTLQRSLARRGVMLCIAFDAAGALAQAAAGKHDFILLDLKLGAESGLDLIVPLRSLCTDARIILMTGYASVATAVDAIKRGADDYLAKPVTAGSLLRLLSGEAIPAGVSDTMTPLARLEWEHIQQALTETGGNVAATARLLGMHRRSLQRKLAKRPVAERSDAERLD